MVDAIMPTWDGNETWLIMAGVSLLAAFPIAYGVLLPAFYLPLIAMLLALGLRGVSFEFRYQVDRHRRLWDLAFRRRFHRRGAGPGTHRRRSHPRSGGGGRRALCGQRLRCLPAVPAAAGLAVLAGYTVLGAGWLHLKATGPLRVFSERVLRLATPVFVALGRRGLYCCRDHSTG